jgi:catechol 2,3-dioxygenase-like lactoylglutathione lyase family enzyme
MLLRIDCVMFRVDDLDSALAFYRDVMGLVPRWREENMAGLDFRARLVPRLFSTPTPTSPLST